MASILVAEDEPVSRAFLHDALRELGHDARMEADGESALMRASEQRFDLLLLDVNLPRSSGPELLARLRADAAAACATVPAIALSAEVDPELERNLRQRGFAAVAAKPIGVEALGRLITQVLSPAEDAGMAGLQHWNDAAALRATAGARPIMQSLRALMLRDLPQQRSLILGSIGDGDFDRACSELHRLRAACGFCGAERLLHALEPLEGAALERRHDDEASAIFNAAVDQLLEAVPD